MATAELSHFVKYGKKIAGAGLNYRYECIVCISNFQVLDSSDTAVAV
jgi:transposase-like protein